MFSYRYSTEWKKIRCYHFCYGDGFHSQCMLGNFRPATCNDIQFSPI